MKLDYWHIRAWGGFEQTAPEQAQPLQPLLAEVMERPPRRLSRYAALALIGAHRCMRHGAQTLPPDTPLYTASEHGPLAETVTLMQDILLRGQAPKPVPFINLSGNAGGFHIAASLGLRGRNITVARESGALGALLELARLEDCAGLLAGSVGEAVWPLADQRRRCGLTSDAAIVEASIWFSLRRDACTGSPRLGYARCNDASRVADWLADAPRWALSPSLAPEAQADLRARLDGAREVRAPLLVAGNMQAVQHVLLSALEQGVQEGLRVASADRGGRLQCFALEPDAG